MATKTKDYRKNHFYRYCLQGFCNLQVLDCHTQNYLAKKQFSKKIVKILKSSKLNTFN